MHTHTLEPCPLDPRAETAPARPDETRPLLRAPVLAPGRYRTVTASSPDRGRSDRRRCVAARANCRNGGSAVGAEIPECGFTGGSLMIAMFAIQIGAQGLGQVGVHI